MLIHRLGLSLLQPLYDAEGGDAGGGASSGAAGTSATSGASGAVGGGTEGPSPIDIDDNALIKIKGSNKPVKFGDHVRGFQSQFTKASQEAARLKQELAAAKAAQAQYEQQAAQRQQGAQPDVYEALRQLPYLSGKDAVEVVQAIGGQIAQRDKILLATLQQLQQMKQMVSGLSEDHTMKSFESKVARVVADAGYDPSWNDWARKLYLAYEGDDLDEQFPSIFAEEAANMEKLIDAKRQSKIQAARRVPFIPGKGGHGNPSKPLEIKADGSAKDIADQLWPLLQGTDT